MIPKGCRNGDECKCEHMRINGTFLRCGSKNIACSNMTDLVGILASLQLKPKANLVDHCHERLFKERQWMPG